MKPLLQYTHEFYISQLTEKQSNCLTNHKMEI